MADNNRNYSISLVFQDIGTDKARVSVDGLGKSFISLDKGQKEVEKSTVKLTDSYKHLKSGFESTTGAMKGYISSLASLVGGTFGIAASIKYVTDLSKSMMTLSASFSKWGIGIGQLQSSIKNLGDSISLTRKETMELYAAYEQQFPVATLQGAENLFKNITKAVGVNKEAIAGMAATLGKLSSEYMDIQVNVENLNELDKERFKSTINLLVISNKMGLQEAKTLLTYINQNKQLSAADKLLKEKEEKNIKIMQDLKKSFEEVAITIGQEIMPLMEQLSKFIKDHLKGVIEWVEKYGKIVVIGGLVLSAGKFLLGIFSSIVKVSVSFYTYLVQSRIQMAAIAADAQRTAISMQTAGGGLLVGSRGGVSTAKGGRGGSMIGGMGASIGLGLAGAGLMAGGGYLGGVSETQRSGFEQSGGWETTAGLKNSGFSQMGGAVLNIGGSTSTGAGIGAGVGSVVPALGTAIGGIAGSVVGLTTGIVTNFEDMMKGFNEVIKDSDDYIKQFKEGLAGAKTPEEKLKYERQLAVQETAKALKEEDQSKMGWLEKTASQLAEYGKRVNDFVGIGVMYVGFKYDEDYEKKAIEIEKIKEQNKVIKDIKKETKEIDTTTIAASAQQNQSLTAISAKAQSYAQYTATSFDINTKLGIANGKNLETLNKMVVSSKEQLEEQAKSLDISIKQSQEAIERGEDEDGNVLSEIALNAAIAILNERMEKRKAITGQIVDQNKLLLNSALAQKQAQDSLTDSVKNLALAKIQAAAAAGGNAPGMIAGGFKEAQASIEQQKKINEASKVKAQTSYDNLKADLEKQGLTQDEIDANIELQGIASNINKIESDRILLNKTADTLFVGMVEEGYKYDKSLASIATQRAEQMVTMIDSVAVGIAAGAEMRMMVIDAAGKQIKINEEMMSKYDAELANVTTSEERRLVLIEQRNKLEVENISLLGKQASAAKALNDAWISAVGASVKGEGRITKIVMAQESKIGVAARQLDMIRSTLSGASGRAGEGEVGYRGSERMGIGGIEGRHMGEAYRRDVGGSLVNVGGTLAARVQQTYRNMVTGGVARGRAGGMLSSTMGGMSHATGAMLGAGAAGRGVSTVTAGGTSAIEAAGIKAAEGGANVLNLSFTFNSMNKREILDTVSTELGKSIDKMATGDRTGR